MVEKLRLRFIVVTMISILAVMVCIVGAIYAVNVYQTNTRSNDMLDYISEMSGQLDFAPGRMQPSGQFEPPFPQDPGMNQRYMPDDTLEDDTADDDDSLDDSDDADDPAASESFDDHDLWTENRRDQMEFRGEPFEYRSLTIDAETPYRTRFFSVTYTDGKYSGSDVSHVASVSEEAAQAYADSVISKGSDKGTIDNYRYLVSEQEDIVTVYFLDISEDIETTHVYLKGSLVVAAVSYAILFILIYFISKAAVRPIAVNIENQKRFITDAEHEIKTPLAIISANAEALEMISGKSEWTSNIKDQVKRSSELVQRLLILSKMDEENISLSFKDFSISDAVLETAAPFGALASSQNKSFDMDIEPGLSYKGDERAIRELVSILTDNAIKYCSKSGNILLSLKRDGRRIILATDNNVDDPDSIDTSLLFNRFYRRDESRSRESGGYGIGLSIAEAVVNAHGGKIDAKKSGDRIIFTASL